MKKRKLLIIYFFIFKIPFFKLNIHTVAFCYETD